MDHWASASLTPEILLYTQVQTIILVALCIRKVDNFGHVPQEISIFFFFLTRQKWGGRGEGPITLYYSE